jgi:hypothetical protein
MSWSTVVNLAQARHSASLPVFTSEDLETLDDWPMEDDMHPYPYDMLEAMEEDDEFVSCEDVDMDLPLRSTRPLQHDLIGELLYVRRRFWLSQQDMALLDEISDIHSEMYSYLDELNSVD